MPETIIAIKHEDDDELEDAIFFLADTLTEGHDLPQVAAENGWRVEIKREQAV